MCKVGRDHPWGGGGLLGGGVAWGGSRDQGSRSRGRSVHVAGGGGPVPTGTGAGLDGLRSLPPAPSRCSPVLAPPREQDPAVVAKAGLRPGIPPPSSRTPTCPVPRLGPLVPLCRIPQSGCTCPPARVADPRRGALAHVCSPGPDQHTCPQVTGGDCGCLRCFCPVTLFSIPPELRSALLCSYCGHFQGTEPQCPIPALWLFLAEDYFLQPTY